MPAYSPKRYRALKVLTWRQAVNPSNRLSFTGTEERWMAARLAAYDAAQTSVPPEIREGNLPRCHGLPEGMSEDDAPPPMAGGALGLAEGRDGPTHAGAWRFRD